MTNRPGHSRPLAPLAEALRRFSELEKQGRLPSEDAWRAMLETEAAVKAALELADARAFSRGKNSALAASAKSGVAGLDRAAAFLARAAGTSLPGGVAGMLARTGDQLRGALDGRGSVEARLAALGAGFVRTSAAGLVPPDPQDAAPATGSGAGWEKSRTEPRLTQFFEAVREIGLFPEDADALVSAPTPGAVRREPYVRLWFPRAEVSVFICEEVGEAMFVVPGEVTESQCTQLGKEGLSALPGTAKIVWAGDWKARLLEALTGNLAEKKLKPKVQVTSATSLPEATEENGWLVDIVWPDGKMEPGRAVTYNMPDIHGVTGFNIRNRVETLRKSGTDGQRRWLEENVKDPGARGENGHPVAVIRSAALEKFCHEECGRSLPKVTEENGWLVDIMWPDGEIEPGRAVTKTMSDVHGAKGNTVLNRLEIWKSGTDEQKKWVRKNVKDRGAKAGAERRVTVVRASALEKLCQEELGTSLPIVTEKNGWLVGVVWPDGKMEPGRAVTNSMRDVYGVKGTTILHRLKAWDTFGSPEQGMWLKENVRFNGARGGNGRPIAAVVRASALEEFCKQLLSQK